MSTKRRPIVTTCSVHRYETLAVSLHTHAPGGRHSSTALSRLLEFCYPRRDSIGPRSPILVGKNSGGSATDTYEFSQL